MARETLRTSGLLGRTQQGQVQARLRGGQGPLPGVRHAFGVLRLNREFPLLRPVGHHQGLQGPEVQLLHVQEVPDILAQVLLPGRPSPHLMPSTDFAILASAHSPAQQSHMNLLVFKS